MASLRRNGLDRPNAPVVVQSFETGNLAELDSLTKVPLVQLLGGSGRPYDFVVSGDPRTYRDLTSPEGLAWIATYADGVGPNKDLVLPRDATGAVGAPSTLVDDAHGQGLLVHVWTLRDENRYLPTNFRIGTEPNAKGDSRAETWAFLDAGVDAVFSDHADTTVAARDDWLAQR